MGRQAQIGLEPNAGDFRLIDRRALDALLAMRERSRFLCGMTLGTGFPHEIVEFDRDPRFAGETEFRSTRMLRSAIDGVSSFSRFPLQMPRSWAS